MRVYKLAAPYHRSYVDLRDFKDIIEQAVHQEVPDAKVVVKEDCYEIDRDISKGDAILSTPLIIIDFDELLDEPSFIYYFHG